MERKVLVAVAVGLVSSAGTLHSGCAGAADAAASAYEDSTVDASLDSGEERISADADNHARLKDLRYAYILGYNARAREDSKSYATLTDEVKHPHKQLPAPVMPASPKPVAARVAPPPERVVARTASLTQVSAPVAAPKPVAAARATSSRHVVAQAEPALLKRIPLHLAPVPQKHVYAHVESVSPRRVSAPAASLKQASVQVTRPKRAEVPPAPLKQVSTRTHQNQQPQQCAAAPANHQASTGAPQSSESGAYSGAEYAPPPPPPQTVQTNRYAPAQSHPAYAQPTYVPRPPTQAAAQRVVIVTRPPAYPAYNQMYTPPELRRPYPAGYGNSAQSAGYQGWQ